MWHDFRSFLLRICTSRTSVPIRLLPVVPKKVGLTLPRIFVADDTNSVT